MLIALPSIGVEHIVDDAVGIAHIAANFIDHQHIGLHIIDNSTQCRVFVVQIVGGGVTAACALLGVIQQVIMHHPDGFGLRETKGYQQ